MDVDGNSKSSNWAFLHSATRRHIENIMIIIWASHTGLVWAQATQQIPRLVSWVFFFQKFVYTTSQCVSSFGVNVLVFSTLQHISFVWNYLCLSRCCKRGAARLHGTCKDNYSSWVHNKLPLIPGQFMPAAGMAVVMEEASGTSAFILVQYLLHSFWILRWIMWFRLQFGWCLGALSEGMTCSLHMPAWILGRCSSVAPASQYPKMLI